MVLFYIIIRPTGFRLDYDLSCILSIRYYNYCAVRTYLKLIGVAAFLSAENGATVLCRPVRDRLRRVLAEHTMLKSNMRVQVILSYEYLMLIFFLQDLFIHLY